MSFSLKLMAAPSAKVGRPFFASTDQRADRDGVVSLRHAGKYSRLPAQKTVRSSDRAEPMADWPRRSTFLNNNDCDGLVYGHLRFRTSRLISDHDLPPGRSCWMTP